MKKTNISYMTWPEVKEIVKQKPTVLIPVGSTEAQNLHNPMGYDYLIAQRLAEFVTQKCNAVMLPTIPFGYSHVFTDFPGTILLRPETLRFLFEDIIKSLIRTGFDHLLFINNHQPNHYPLVQAIYNLKEENKIICTSIFPSGLAKSFSQDLFPDAKNVLNHGNEPSTSLIKYLYPELQRLDLFKTTKKPMQFKNFKLDPISNFEFQGQKVTAFLNMSDISKEGGWSNSSNSKGDLEIGKTIFNKMVDFLTSFICEFNKTSI